MKVLLVCGRHQYGDPARGESTEHHAFATALEALGHQVTHFESWDLSSYTGLAALNQALLQTVECERPEVLLSVQTDYEIWTETLDVLRFRGDVATVTWTTDDSWKFPQVSRFIGPHYHAITTTYSDRLQDYAANDIRNVLLTQWAANSKYLVHPLPANQCDYDVTFVGGASSQRRAFVAEAQKLGVAIQCFGHGWPSGSVAASDIPTIMRRSRISLNLAAGSRGGPKQIKARLFEVPGSGGFLLSEHAPGQEQWFRNDVEVSSFRDVGEFVEKARFYLKNPERRDQVAFAGFERTRAEHTYERRLEEVLGFAIAAKVRGGSPTAARRAEILKTWHDSFSAQPPGLVLSAARWAAINGLGLFVGRRRAHRYSRRILFEASWRLVGAQTFSARGLPGRLFPRP